MSSTSAPFGFRPSFHNSGQIRSKAYNMAASYSTAIFQGDLVALDTNGQVVIAGTTNTSLILGVFQGVQYNDASGKPTISNFWPGTTTGATNIVAYVMDDPEALFDVQVTNPSSGTSMQTYVGNEAVWVPGAGSTSTGLSNSYLSNSFVASTSSSQLQVTGFGYGPDNAITDAYVVVTVRINTHQYKASVASI